MLKDPAQLRMDLEECLKLDEEEMIELANFLGVKYC